MLRSRGCDFARVLRSLLQWAFVAVAVVALLVVVVASVLRAAHATTCSGTGDTDTDTDSTAAVVGTVLLCLRHVACVAVPVTRHVAAC